MRELPSLVKGVSLKKHDAQKPGIEIPHLLGVRGFKSHLPH